LQEPLRKIKTFANLLQLDLDLSEKQARYFSKIQNSSDRMANLIRDVLEYSKLSKGEASFVETDLNEIIESIKIDLELLISETGATIVTENLPVLKAMPLQMTQLFSNLIHNAIKFCDQQPLIEISCCELQNRADNILLNHLSVNRNYFHISIRDNGIGFDQHYTEKIFTIFQRLGDAESSGTGIGLALCKKIVENHDGLITADSIKGEGATFNVFLPIDLISENELFNEELTQAS
jgi:signal transduction histidine kinase